MADFSFHSDTDESAVEQVLAEAMDHIVLEQVAAINCSSFSSDSVLPSHLESRFQRLKTFPSTSKPKHQLNPSTPKSTTKVQGSSNEAKDEKPISDDCSKVSEKEKNPEEKSCSSGYLSSPSDSSNSPSGHGNFTKSRAVEAAGKAKNGNSRPRSTSFRSDSSTETVKSGCFWCSPKKVPRKKSGTRNGVVKLGFDWENDDELLSDLKSFSSKEQKKLMKKAMKEEDKIIKEAQKIVKWAKQSSSRMDFSLSDDDLSDDGHTIGHR